MVRNCSIVAVTLLFGVSGKSKAFRNESKTIGEKAERSGIYERVEINEIVTKVLENFSENYRYIFKERFIENRPQAEIGRAHV